MMRMTIATALLATLGLGAVEATAQVFFKEPIGFAGTGCGAGSYVVSGADTDTLTILFSSYDAARPASHAASGLERSSCSFALPISVPAGCQVSLLNADWRGFAEGDTEFFREYFFAGQTKSISKTTSPAGNYTERDRRLRHESYSLAGEEVILRINSSVRALAEESYIALDTADLHNTLILHLEQEDCGQAVLPAILNILL